MSGQRVTHTREKKSVWDSCSTAHVSLSGKTMVALNSIGRDNNISQSKVVQVLLYESKTFSDTIEKLTDHGMFDKTESRYDQFKRKQNALKSS